MDLNDINENSLAFYKAFWEEPDRHALVKGIENNSVYYTMYTTKPRLMFLICDDVEYVVKLSAKMIEHGVKVYDSFEDLLMNIK
jgi:hypothetical protein